MHSHTILLIFLVKVNLIYMENCKNQFTCLDCLLTPSCYWYYNFHDTTNDTGCYPEADLAKLSPEYIFTRPNELKIKRDKPLNQMIVERDETTRKVIIQPQRVHLLARINETFQIPFLYTPPDNQTSVQMIATLRKQHENEQINVTLQANCSHFLNNTCNNLSYGDVVQFTAEITPLHCPIDPFRAQQKILVHPINGLEDNFEIELNMMCYCPCAFPSFPYLKHKAEECHQQGTFNCGVCLCDEGFSGRECSCNKGINGTCF